MRREPPAVGKATRGGEQMEEPRQEMPSRDGRPMHRDLARDNAVPHGERVLQQRLHVAWPDYSRMRVGDLATASDQMRETRLMGRVVELPIRRPTVAHEHAVKVGAEHGGRLLKAPPVLNGVDDRVRRRKDPQPPEPAADFPTGFIGTDDGTPADLVPQGRVGGGRLACGPMQGLGDATRAHGQSEPVTQQRGDLAVRQAQLLIEQDDQGHRVRTQVRARRTERIRRLQRVAALDAPATLPAAADMHVKPTHVRPDDGQIFLGLRGDPRLPHPSAAVRTRGWQRHVNRFVDVRRWPTMGVTTMSRTAPPSRPPAGSGRCALRERRRLPFPRSPRGRQRLRQSLDLPPQPVPLAFQSRLVTGQLIPIPSQLPSLPLQPRIVLADAFRFATRPFNLAAQLLQLALGVVDRSGFALRHASVMPDPRSKYKYGILDRTIGPANQLRLRLVS
jgi:hypothetical protein